MFRRTSGIGFIITSIACMGFGYFVLGKLDSYTTNPRTSGSVNAEDMPVIVAWLMQYRMIYVFLGLVPFVGGVMLILNAKPRSLWYALGLFGTVALFALLVMCMIYFIAPMYQYQDLTY
ncbi:MAG: hypothetical protein O7G85_08025 [Planctomycetota bacterium]|nr:hypothetical protein [Planctomycetota bacterium]